MQRVAAVGQGFFELPVAAQAFHGGGLPAPPEGRLSQQHALVKRWGRTALAGLLDWLVTYHRATPVTFSEGTDFSTGPLRGV